jgi:hypothetical protein
MIAKILALPPLALKAAGMALVGLVLIGGSLAFGVFDGNYDINGPYDQLYPVSSPDTP